MQGMWRYLWRGMPVWGTDGGAEGFSQSHIRGISSQTSKIIRIWGRVILSRTGYLFTRLFEMLWFWNRLGQTHMILYWKSREFWHTAIRCFRVLRTAGRRTCFFRCSDKDADSSSVPGRKGRMPYCFSGRADPVRRLWPWSLFSVRKAVLLHPASDFHMRAIRQSSGGANWFLPAPPYSPPAPARSSALLFLLCKAAQSLFESRLYRCFSNPYPWRWSPHGHKGSRRRSYQMLLCKKNEKTFQKEWEKRVAILQQKFKNKKGVYKGFNAL